MIGRIEGYIKPSDIIPINIKNNQYTYTHNNIKTNVENKVDKVDIKGKETSTDMVINQFNDLPLITQSDIEYLMKDKEIKYIKPDVILDENKIKKVRKTKTENKTETEKEKKIDKTKLYKSKKNKKNLESVKESNISNSNDFIKSKSISSNSLLKLKIKPDFNEEQLNNLIIPSSYLLNKKSNQTLKTSSNIKNIKSNIKNIKSNIKK